MSATARRHRRAAARWRTEETLEDAAAAPPVSVGVRGSMELFMRGKVMYVLPRVTPEMPDELAEAITRRRQATLEGTCACGGSRDRHTPAAKRGHVVHDTFWHEDDCIAHEDAINDILARCGWERA